MITRSLLEPKENFDRKLNSDLKYDKVTFQFGSTTSFPGFSLPLSLENPGNEVGFLG